MHEKNTKLEWGQCQDLLDPDGGAFLEIHVPDQSREEYIAILEHLRSTYPDLHFVAHPADSIPPPQEHLTIPSERERMLYFAHDGLGLYCHIVELGQIELSFDVREVKLQHHLDTLSEIIVGIADHVGRDVLITPENLPTNVCGRFNFANRNFKVAENA